MTNLNCIRCDIEFKRNEKGIVKCLICCEKYHAKCAKLTEEEVSLILNNDNINYSCKICNKIGILAEIKELKSMILNISTIMQEQQESIINTNEVLSEFVKHKVGKESIQHDQIKKSSYADVLTKNKEVLLIKPMKEQKNDETRKDLKVNIDPSKLAVGVENVKNIKNGGVVINCANANSKDIIKNKVVEVMGDKYKVEDGSFKKPKLIVSGVEEEFLNMENEEIIKAVVEQNDVNLEGKLTVVKKYKKKNKKNSVNIIIEVEPDKYVNLIKKEKINIGWRKCNIYDYFDITRCFKCAGYNHKSNKCTNNITCFKCGENHITNECKSEILKCINCLTIREKLKINVNPDHAANDLNCPCYKRHVERQCNETKYTA